MNVFRCVAMALPLAAALCFCSLAKAQEDPQKAKQAIQVGVDRVNVGVIVTDQSGHFVEGLRRESFHVFDNGAEQQLTGFTAIEEPAQVLLLIEAGPAVYLLESSHVWAANSLLEGLSADDRVAIVRYAEAPQVILDFTSDKRAAAASLDQLRFNLGFGSLNLSSSVSKVLESLEEMKGKKTIVLLSTGVDTSSPEEWTATMQRLKLSDIRLLAVSLSGGLQNAQPGSKKKSSVAKSSETTQQLEEAGELLKQMAAATGGRAYFPSSAKEFSSVYAEIARIIRHEYSLAFAPPVLDGLVHSIDVQVRDPRTSTAGKQTGGYRVDHRQGYTAPRPQNEPASDSREVRDFLFALI